MSGRTPVERVPSMLGHEVNSMNKRTRTQSPVGHSTGYSYGHDQTGHFSLPLGANYDVFRAHFQQQQNEQHLDFHDYHDIERQRPSLLANYNVPEKIEHDSLRVVTYGQQQMQSSLPSQLKEIYHQPPQQHGSQSPHLSKLQPGTSTTHLYDIGSHPYKRPRMISDFTQPLNIDTQIKKESSYKPQVEAISPTLPNDDSTKDDIIRQSKDEILQNINKIDREITKVEQNIQKLQKKQEQLEQESKRPPEEKLAAQDILIDLKQQSIAQIIYAENRLKAEDSHSSLFKHGEPTPLPHFHQPSDTEIYYTNKEKFVTFKKRLINLLKKQHQATQIRDRYLTDRYEQLIFSWVKRMEKTENSAKRRAKDAKMREFFEKIFPELRKQREDKERLQSRYTSGGNRVAGYARSEANLEQIVDGLHEQEEEEKKRANLAVVPPLMLDARQKRMQFLSENCRLDDINCETTFKGNFWTQQEKAIFKEKYIAHPKNFPHIASFLESKSVQDCVLYYYSSKKNENYKQLVRRHNATRKKTDKIKRSAAPMREVKEEKVDETEESSNNASSSEEKKTSSQLEKQDKPEKLDKSGQSHQDKLVPDCTKSSAGVDENSTATNSNSSAQTEALTNEPGFASNTKDVCENLDQESRLMDGPYECALCKLQVGHLSRPVTKATCDLYGFKESEVTPDMRVCSSCRCKSIHRKCPVPTCKTPRRKVKQLRYFPSKFQDLPSNIKESILSDIKVTSANIRCCSSCFNRVARLMNSLQEPSEPMVPLIPENTDDAIISSRWTEDEIDKAKQGLTEHGHNWSEISLMVGTKSDVQCKTFYLKYKKKLNLVAIMKEYKLNHGVDETNVVSEEEDEDVAVTDEDGNVSDEDDTFPQDDNNHRKIPVEVNEDCNKTLTESTEGTKIIKDTKLDELATTASTTVTATGGLSPKSSLTASHSSLPSIADNDSSATLSADEGSHNDDTHKLHSERSSNEGHSKLKTTRREEISSRTVESKDVAGMADDVKVTELGSLHAGVKTTSTLGTGGDQNQSDMSKGSQSCVRDIIDSAIERNVLNENLYSPNYNRISDTSIRSSNGVARPKDSMKSRSNIPFDELVYKYKDQLMVEQLHVQNLPYHSTTPENLKVGHIMASSTEFQSRSVDAIPQQAHSHHKSMAKFQQYDVPNTLLGKFDTVTTKISSDKFSVDYSDEQKKNSGLRSNSPLHVNENRSAASKLIAQGPPPLIKEHAKLSGRMGTKIMQHSLHVGGSIVQGIPVMLDNHTSGSIQMGTPRHDIHKSKSPQSLIQDDSGSIIKGTPKPHDHLGRVLTGANIPMMCMDGSKKLYLYNPVEHIQQERSQSAGYHSLQGYHSNSGQPYPDLSRAVLMEDFITAQQMHHAKEHHRLNVDKDQHHKTASPRSRDFFDDNLSSYNVSTYNLVNAHNKEGSVIRGRVDDGGRHHRNQISPINEPGRYAQSPSVLHLNKFGGNQEINNFPIGLQEQIRAQADAVQYQHFIEQQQSILNAKQAELYKQRQLEQGRLLMSENHNKEDDRAPSRGKLPGKTVPVKDNIQDTDRFVKSGNEITSKSDPDKTPEKGVTTAANLIDAIIIEQINKDPSSSKSTTTILSQLAHSDQKQSETLEQNIPSIQESSAYKSLTSHLNTPQTVVSSVESARIMMKMNLQNRENDARLQMTSPATCQSSKVITLGEHIDQIIIEDYNTKDGNSTGSFVSTDDTQVAIKSFLSSNSNVGPSSSDNFRSDSLTSYNTSRRPTSVVPSLHSQQPIWSNEFQQMNDQQNLIKSHSVMLPSDESENARSDDRSGHLQKKVARLGSYTNPVSPSSGSRGFSFETSSKSLSPRSPRGCFDRPLSSIAATHQTMTSLLSKKGYQTENRRSSSGGGDQGHSNSSSNVVYNRKNLDFHGLISKPSSEESSISDVEATKQDFSNTECEFSTSWEYQQIRSSSCNDSSSSRRRIQESEGQEQSNHNSIDGTKGEKISDVPQRYQQSLVDDGSLKSKGHINCRVGGYGFDTSDKDPIIQQLPVSSKTVSTDPSDFTRTGFQNKALDRNISSCAVSSTESGEKRCENSVVLSGIDVFQNECESNRNTNTEVSIKDNSNDYNPSPDTKSHQTDDNKASQGPNILHRYAYSDTQNLPEWQPRKSPALSHPLEYEALSDEESHGRSVDKPSH